MAEQGWAHHYIVRQTEAPFGQLSKTHIGLGNPETINNVLISMVIMFGKPVIVVIEDGWHGNLKMGFFQGHKWEKTGVEKNVEFDKPANFKL